MRSVPVKKMAPGNQRNREPEPANQEEILLAARRKLNYSLSHPIVLCVFAHTRARLS